MPSLLYSSSIILALYHRIKFQVSLCSPIGASAPFAPICEVTRRIIPRPVLEGAAIMGREITGLSHC